MANVLTVKARLKTVCRSCGVVLRIISGLKVAPYSMLLAEMPICSTMSSAGTGRPACSALMTPISAHESTSDMRLPRRATSSPAGMASARLPMVPRELSRPRKASPSPACLRYTLKNVPTMPFPSPSKAAPTSSRRMLGLRPARLAQRCLSSRRIAILFHHVRIVQYPNQFMREPRRGKAPLREACLRRWRRR